MITKFGIFIDKNNETNKKFFSKKRIFKKIKSKIKIDINYNKKSFKKYEHIFLLGFISKINLIKNKNFYTVHESNLPKGKGMSPMKHQIMNGKNEITACLIRINNKIDDGDIIYKNKIRLKSTDLFDDIKLKQMKVTENLIVKLINNIEKLKFYKQKGKSTFYKKLNLKDDEIDFNKSIKTQFNKIRSTNHYKYKNFFFFKNEKYSINIKKFK